MTGRAALVHQVRGEARAVWVEVRARPVRHAAILLAATVAVATVASTAVTLVTDPWQAAGTLVSTPLFLGAVAVVLWGLVWACGSVSAGFVRWWLPMPRHAADRLASAISAAAPLVGAAVAELVVLLAATGGLVVAVATAAVLAALAAVTRQARQRAVVLRWLVGHLVGAAREFDPHSGTWVIRDAVWDGDRLMSATAYYPDQLRVSEPGRRAGIERALMWAMRHDPRVWGLRWADNARAVDLVAEPPLPDRIVDGRWPDVGGIVVGACAMVHADAHVIGPDDSPIGLRVWDPDAQRDLLIAGVKGSGKTILARGIVVRGLSSGAFPAGVMILDGKGSADYASLEGRDGVLVVARSPQQWRAALDHLVAIMRERYEADYAFESGRSSERMTAPRLCIVLDEVQNILYEVPEALDPLNQLARMARGGRITIVAVTQRPDAKDAIPGAIRDQLEDRVAVGWMSEQGGRMVLEGDWRLVVDDDGSADTMPRGRAVARIAGRLCRIQVPWLDSPVHDPSVEGLYPRRDGTPPAPTPPAPSPQTPAVPAPRSADDTRQPATPTTDFFE
ncbi:hypothetical protein [Salinispora pacifica]|uniref:hypothetical protein n=1 Tax=Salinispora pacifica TaxID=351187 RepID=UPI000377D463|nr:hypothetical protein [Salinispora pacifica]